MRKLGIMVSILSVVGLRLFAGRIVLEVCLEVDH